MAERMLRSGRYAEGAELLWPMLEKHRGQTVEGLILTRLVDAHIAHGSPLKTENSDREMLYLLNEKK